MPDELCHRFERDGYLVLEDFYSPEEVEDMLKAGKELPSQAPKEDRKVFQNEGSNLKYFLESGDKIRFFFENEVVGPNNELLVPEEVSLNKVGHALAVLHPTFRKYTFDNRIRELCRNIGLQQPAVAQSMYMFKNPGIDSTGPSHQDATYLYTEPSSCVGFWIALEDATLENGCLKFIPGSHKNGVHRRYMRNPDKSSNEALIYDQPETFYESSNFKACPVKFGTLIVIHSLVVHRSDVNKSKGSRNAYTFHVIETKDTEYSKDNWLQPNEPFPVLYE